MQIERNGAQDLPPFPASVIPASPGIFTLDGSGYGQAAALNQDGTVNSAGNPAAQGSVGSFCSFFLTGGGAMTAVPADGSIPAGHVAAFQTGPQIVNPAAGNTSASPGLNVTVFVN
jgi:uncharacterized protein (TIGR03437 family)